MSIADQLFADKPSVPAATATKGSATAERKKSRLWADITIHIGDDDDGKPVYARLPSGLAIDTMEFSRTDGTNADWNNDMALQNKFLRTLQEAGESVAPGETRRITSAKISVSLRRLKEAAAVSEEVATGTFDL